MTEPDAVVFEGLSTACREEGRTIGTFRPCILSPVSHGYSSISYSTWTLLAVLSPGFDPAAADCDHPPEVGSRNGWAGADSRYREPRSGTRRAGQLRRLPSYHVSKSRRRPAAACSRLCAVLRSGLRETGTSNSEVDPRLRRLQHSQRRLISTKSSAVYRSHRASSMKQGYPTGLARPEIGDDRPAVTTSSTPSATRREAVVLGQAYTGTSSGGSGGVSLVVDPGRSGTTEGRRERYRRKRSIGVSRRQNARPRVGLHPRLRWGTRSRNEFRRWIVMDLSNGVETVPEFFPTQVDAGRYRRPQQGGRSGQFLCHR